MTIDDTTIIVALATLGGAVAFMWRIMQRNYEKDIKCLRVDLKDAIDRIRKLEDWRTEQLKKLADRYDESVLVAAAAIKELAAHVNANTQAIKSTCLQQEHLPTPSKAADVLIDKILIKK
jgi:hypothetical protein